MNADGVILIEARVPDASRQPRSGAPGWPPDPPGDPAATPAQGDDAHGGLARAASPSQEQRARVKAERGRVGREEA